MLLAALTNPCAPEDGAFLFVHLHSSETVALRREASGDTEGTGKVSALLYVNLSHIAWLSCGALSQGTVVPKG